MTSFLGIDTSNYTTSAACCRADGSGYNSSQLLTVKSGELGLRQNEALFQHIKNLPQRFAELREAGFLQDIAAVGASTQPRAVEGSYMPCFLAGASQGRILAETLGVPFYAFSHQQGHIAAVCWAAKKLELLDQPMLAWHLSGGTTELLLVVPENGNVRRSAHRPNGAVSPPGLSRRKSAGQAGRPERQKGALSGAYGQLAVFLLRH